jgi:hypothetical protein
MFEDAREAAEKSSGLVDDNEIQRCEFRLNKSHLKISKEGSFQLILKCPKREKFFYMK